MHTVSLNIECRNWFDCRFWGSAPGDIHLCTLCTRPHIVFHTQHTELSHLSRQARQTWLILSTLINYRNSLYTESLNAFFFSLFVYLSCLWLSLFRILTWLYRESWVSFFLSSVDFELHTFSMGELWESTTPIIIPGAREVIAVRAAQLLIV